MKIKNKKALLIIAFPVLIAVIVIFLSSRTNSLPSYALQNSKVKEAYLFAKDNPQALEGIKCYCGCMTLGEDGRVHKDLKDCYFKEDGSWEEHASRCNVCINEALQVKSLIAQNKTKQEINQILSSEY